MGKKYEFEDAEIHLICVGLNELVRKNSQPILEKIQAQFDAQNTPQQQVQSEPVKRRGRRPKQ